MDNKRYEFKYIINRKYIDVLKQYLEMFMQLDSNKYCNEYYYVRSMYFDDYKNTSYLAHINGLNYREKFRIRFYNFNDTYINLEKKTKDGKYVIKENYNITKKDFNNILNCNYDKIITDNKTANEFIMKCKCDGFHPSVIVDYKRIAYVYPFENIRVTIDFDISSLGKNLNIFDKNAILYSVMNDNEALLEIKYDNYFPDFLSKILVQIPKTKVSFSKYALCKEVNL